MDKIEIGDEVEMCHRILRRVRSAAGLPDRYPSFAAKPPSDFDGEEIATRVAAALSLLREIEWRLESGDTGACPICGGPGTHHDAPCRLVDFLK